MKKSTKSTKKSKQNGSALSTLKQTFCSKLNSHTNINIETDEEKKKGVDEELQGMKFGGLELIQENSQEESLQSISEDYSLTLTTKEKPHAQKSKIEHALA